MRNGPTEDELQPDVLFRRPDHYLLEFAGPNAIFVRMTRESYRNSIFTDRRRIVAASPQAWGAPIANLIDQYEKEKLPQPRLGFIFHVAHCGSTLLARALDQTSHLLVYREPFPLRQLAAEYAALPSGPDGGSWARRLRLATGLLGRTFDDNQSAIVKANVPVNFVLPELMQLNPDSCAILLYAPLHGYLLSVLKSPQHQSWVGNVVRELAAGIKRNEVLADVALERLAPPQAAACLWLAQMSNYRSLLETSDNVRSLDCETFFERPGDTLTAAFELFGAQVSAQEVSDIVASDLFSHHAKSPGYRFDNDSRKAELRKLAETLDDQIKEGMDWLSEILGPDRVPDTLSKALLA